MNRIPFFMTTPSGLERKPRLKMSSTSKLVPKPSIQILIIRRDNIGDLVCTLPLISRLREHYPHAWIGALVTNYTEEVLQANPELNTVFSYTKAKHLKENESIFKTMYSRLKQLWQLRQKQIDVILLPASGLQASARRMAKLIGAKRILEQDDMLVDPTTLHEVERSACVLWALDIPKTKLPRAKIYPRSDLLVMMQTKLGVNSILGLHISARKLSERWPAERYIELIQRLSIQSPQLRIALFWSPGAKDNSMHPGDDTKAQIIIEACVGFSLIPIQVTSLAELIAGLAACSKIICSNGGHMHLAAALSKPIVCLFGNADSARWCPWGVPHQLIQPVSLNVNDITVEQVLTALSHL